MFKRALITVITLFLTNTASANNVYIPAISVSEYQQALNSGNEIVFRYTKLPDQFKKTVLNNFASATNANNDRIVFPNIINGTNSQRGEYPEFTLLMLENNGSIFPFCGATLVSDKKVLTAAHCSTYDARYFFIPNFYSYSDFPNGAGTPNNRLFLATDKAIHPEHSGTDNDIAIFTLAKSATTKKAVLYNGYSSLAGSNGTAIGVGAYDGLSRPDTLQKVDVPIVSNSECQRAWGLRITESILCTGSLEDPTKLPCHSDSGGPLWSNVDGQRVQTGIISFGSSDCHYDNKRVYSGYTRISEFIGFIRQHAPNISLFYKPKLIDYMMPIYQLLLY